MLLKWLESMEVWWERKKAHQALAFHTWGSPKKNSCLESRSGLDILSLDFVSLKSALLFLLTFGVSNDGMPLPMNQRMTFLTNASAICEKKNVDHSRQTSIRSFSRSCPTIPISETFGLHHRENKFGFRIQGLWIFLG